MHWEIAGQVLSNRPTVLAASGSHTTEEMLSQKVAQATRFSQGLRGLADIVRPLAWTVIRAHSVGIGTAAVRPCTLRLCGELGRAGEGIFIDAVDHLPCRIKGPQAMRTKGRIGLGGIWVLPRRVPPPA